LSQTKCKGRGGEAHLKMGCYPEGGVFVVNFLNGYQSGYYDKLKFLNIY